MTNETNIITKKYLDLHYPSLKERLNTISLDINNKQLIGILDLTDFINLESLICSNNQLTELDLTNCCNLKLLQANNNKLQQYSLTSIKDLNNLERLELQGNEEINGSLLHLQGLECLKKLDISNTKINTGLEYLPTNIEDFCCQNCPLERILGGNGKYNIQTWQRANQEKLMLFKISDELIPIHKSISNFLYNWVIWHEGVKTKIYQDVIDVATITLISCFIGLSLLAHPSIDFQSKKWFKNSWFIASITIFSIYFVLFIYYLILYRLLSNKEKKENILNFLYVKRSLIYLKKIDLVRTKFISVILITSVIIGSLWSIFSSQQGIVFATIGTFFQVLNDKVKREIESSIKDLQKKEKHFIKKFSEDLSSLKDNCQKLVPIFHKLALLESDNPLSEIGNFRIEFLKEFGLDIDKKIISIISTIDEKKIENWTPTKKKESFQQVFIQIQHQYFQQLRQLQLPFRRHQSILSMIQTQTALMIKQNLLLLKVCVEEESELDKYKEIFKLFWKLDSFQNKINNFREHLYKDLSNLSEVISQTTIHMEY